MAGKNTTKASRKISAAKNGAMPLKIETRGTLGIIDFITNTFNPMGGVIKLISTTMTITIPNHIKLKPIASTNGTNIGTVRKIIASPSIIVPNKTYINNITNITLIGEIERVFIKSMIALGISAMFTKLFRMRAPKTIVKIIADVSAASARE